jgi:hypothetical protein
MSEKPTIVFLAHQLSIDAERDSLSRYLDVLRPSSDLIEVDCINDLFLTLSDFCNQGKAVQGLLVDGYLLRDESNIRFGAWGIPTLTADPVYAGVQISEIFYGSAYQSERDDSTRPLHPIARHCSQMKIASLTSAPDSIKGRANPDCILIMDKDGKDVEAQLSAWIKIYGSCSALKQKFH